MRPLPTWIPPAAAFGLFLVWSNSFIAMSYLLGTERAGRKLDWVALAVARFLPAAAASAAYCLTFRRRESWALARAHWPRLLACGFLTVPGYNLCLYYGQQHGVPAPVASLTTALVPLFVMLLALTFLGERPGWRWAAGFAISATGMALVAAAKAGSGLATYPLLLVITAGAPLCWSIYTVLSKPITAHASPVVWTYLSTSVGGLMVLPLLPGDVAKQWAALDAPGWAALLYLIVPCTVLGFAVWTWLLRHLPASSVGFTVFLNPPLTTTSKYLLALFAPATFLFTIRGLEIAGGLLVLAGVGVALRPFRLRKRLRGTELN